MIFRPREDWQDPAQPVVGPAMQIASVELLPAHYTAANSIPDDIPPYLRSMQNDYTVNRGYSVGYNFAIDQTGEAWELRGFDIKCAANKDMNDVTIAILCMVDGADAMNDAMVARFQALAAEAQTVAGRALFVVGHRDIGSTTCPGDGIYGQVQAGILDPDDAQPEPPPTGDDDMATTVFIPTDCAAQFVGQTDRNKVATIVWWADKARTDAHIAAGAEVDDKLSLGGFTNCVLVGPLPTGDDRHEWTGAEFFRVVT